MTAFENHEGHAANGTVTNGTVTNEHTVNGTATNGGTVNGATTNGTSHVTGPQNADDGDIAIIGMSCRLPQDAETTSKLWDFLLDGRSSMTPIPPERFTGKSHYHPDPGHGGTVSYLC